MDYTREGGYFYPRESGMDKDEEEEVSEVVVHEKGRNTVGFFFASFLVSRCISPPPSLADLYPSALSHETTKGKDEQPPQWADYQYYWAGASHHRA